MWFKRHITGSFRERRWGPLFGWFVLATVAIIVWLLLEDRIAAWANEQIDEKVPGIVGSLSSWITSDSFYVQAWLIVVTLLVIGFVVLYRQSGRPSPGKPGKHEEPQRLTEQADNPVIASTVEELRQFCVTIGGKELDAPTIVHEIWEELSLGKAKTELTGIIGKKLGLESAGAALFDATDSLMAKLRSLKVVQIDLINKQYLRGSEVIQYCRLTDFGADVIQQMMAYRPVDKERAKAAETKTEEDETEKKPRIFSSWLMINDQRRHQCTQCGWGMVVGKYDTGVVCPKCGNADTIWGSGL